MKMTILLLFAFAGIDSAYGQCPSNKRQLDISVSYGVISTDQVFGVPNDDGATVSGQKTLTNSPGSPYITARYFFFNRLAFGVTCGFLSESGKYVDTYTPSITGTGTYTSHSTVTAFEVYYIYLFRKNMELYTLGGIGPSFSSANITTNVLGLSTTSHAESVNTTKVQYTPIGIRYGGKLGAYAELGIGYKGVFNAGISYKLGPSSWWKE